MSSRNCIWNAVPACPPDRTLLQVTIIYTYTTMHITAIFRKLTPMLMQPKTLILSICAGLLELNACVTKTTAASARCLEHFALGPWAMHEDAQIGVPRKITCLGPRIDHKVVGLFSLGHPPTGAGLKTIQFVYGSKSTESQ